mgnify:CR=1 FL=1
MEPLKVPIVAKILDNLSPEQLKKVHAYAQKKPFSHGYYWYGPEGELGIKTQDSRFSSLGNCACVLAVAFDVNVDHYCPVKSRTAARVYGLALSLSCQFSLTMP